MTEGRLAHRRRIRRRRQIALLSILAFMAGLATYFVVYASDGDATPQAMNTEPLNTESVAPYTDSVADDHSPTASPSPEPPQPLYFSGNGTWTYAPAAPGVVFGESGTLMKYNVAVEDGLELDVEEVSAFVAATLSDRRSWTAGGDWRFEQVGKGGADFTVYLASPEQRSVLCGHPNKTVSCRNGDAVVINSARWIAGVDHWDGTLDTYREYVVNHEVGHRLGNPHELCPEEGKLSPVMAQQTYQLGGCIGNAWPFPDGERYVSGPPGEYGGPELPPDDYDDRLPR